MSEELATSIISTRPKLVEKISPRLINAIKTDDRSNVEQSDPMEKLVKCVENSTTALMNQQVATLRHQEIMLKQQEAVMKQKEAAMKQQEAAMKQQEAAMKQQEAIMNHQEKLLTTLTSSHQEVIKQLGERSQAGLLLPLTIRDLVTLVEREGELSQLIKEEKYVSLGFEVVIRGSSRTEEMVVRQKIESLITTVRTRMEDDHIEEVQDVVKVKKSTTEEQTSKEAVLHHDDQESCVLLEVSNLEAALVLGGGKKMLFYIQDKTGAKIIVSGKASDSKREVKMTGSKEALMKVQEEVARVIKDGVHERITLTRGVVGKLLKAGARGLIEKKSGAAVKFYGKVNDVLREVVLSGSKESTQAGLTMLIDMVGVCKTVSVTPDTIQWLLGGGKNIQRIRKESGAEVYVTGKLGDEDRKVIFSGSGEAITKALDMMWMSS